MNRNQNLLSIVLSAITGALVALVFQRMTNAAEKSSRASRSLREIAPNSYPVLTEQFTNDDQLYEDHQRAWSKFVRDSIQTNLTEREAMEVAQAILDHVPPAYTYHDTLFPSWEKEEGKNS